MESLHFSLQSLNQTPLCLGSKIRQEQACSEYASYLSTLAPNLWEKIPARASLAPVILLLTVSWEQFRDLRRKEWSKTQGSLREKPMAPSLLPSEGSGKRCTQLEAGLLPITSRTRGHLNQWWFQAVHGLGHIVQVSEKKKQQHKQVQEMAVSWPMTALWEGEAGEMGECEIEVRTVGRSQETHVSGLSIRGTHLRNGKRKTTQKTTLPYGKHNASTCLVIR